VPVWDLEPVSSAHHSQRLMSPASEKNHFLFKCLPSVKNYGFRLDDVLSLKIIVRNAIRKPWYNSFNK